MDDGPAVPDTIATYYKVVATLGRGSFGHVVKAVDTRTGVRVAIKLEEKHAEYPQLLYEARILEQLGHNRGIPELYWYNSFQSWNVLVMPLLGISLEADRLASGGTLPIVKLIDIAQQGLDRLRTLHEKGWAYRDIKPENFVWHRSHGKTILYLIDFGLCKRMIYPGTSFHITNRSGKTLTGTPRYASLHAHSGIEQSRRDDVESFVYMLIYLAKGALPWQRLPPSKTPGSENNFAKIAACKNSINLDVLCEGLPPGCKKTLQYARALEFEDMPDYTYMDRLWK